MCNEFIADTASQLVMNFAASIFAKYRI